MRFLKDYGHTFKRAFNIQKKINMPINLKKTWRNNAGIELHRTSSAPHRGKRCHNLRLRQIIEKSSRSKTRWREFLIRWQFSYYNYIDPILIPCFLSYYIYLTGVKPIG